MWILAPDRRVATLIVGLMLLFSGPAVAQEMTPSEQLALDAYRSGELDRSMELYTQALSETEDPNHRARLQVQTAWILFNIGRLDEVSTHLSAAVVEDPTLTLLSDYYTDEFLELFERARRTTYEAGTGSSAPPPDLEATVAGVQDRIGSNSDLEGALADTDRLLEAYPRDGRLIPLKVEILRQLGRTDEAETLALSHGAGSDVPSYDDGYSVPDLILRAGRLLEEGDATTALQLLHQAVNRRPTDVAALELMAEAAQMAADWQTAEIALKRALALQPDSISLKLRLGEVYLATYEASEARDLFTSLTEDYPHSDRAWASLGLLEARLGNHERALEALGRALHENTMLPEVQLAYGELLLLDGDFEGALESLMEAEKLLPSDAQLEARLGQAFLAGGRHREALTHLRTAVDSGFVSSDVERSLAMALALNGMYSESQRVLATIDSDATGDIDLISGYLDLMKSDYSEAESTLTQLAKDRAGDPATINLLAAAVYPQWRFEDSVALLNRAHELDPEVLVVFQNLEKARAALAAENLGNNARNVKAIPQK